MADSSSTIRMAPAPLRADRPALLLRTAVSGIDVHRLPRPDHGKFQMKSGSRARPAFDRDLARVLLDDPVGYRKPQSRPAPLPLFGTFGSKKRIVDALDMLLRDPRTCVRNCDIHPSTIGCSHGQSPTLGHGIFG